MFFLCIYVDETLGTDVRNPMQNSDFKSHGRAEKVKPSMFLLVGIRKGNQHVKLRTKITY